MRFAGRESCNRGISSSCRSLSKGKSRGSSRETASRKTRFCTVGTYRTNRIEVANPNELFAAIAFIVVVLFGAIGALTAQEHGENRGDAAKVMALETLWNQAEVDKDVRASGQIVPDTFIYVDIDGSLRTKSEFLDSVKSGAEQPTEIRNESVVAHSYANTVVVTGVYREKGSAGGKRYSRRGVLQTRG